MYHHAWSDSRGPIHPVTPSLNAKSGRGGRGMLSQFWPPSASASMPISPNPPSKLYEDPAFSPDPQSHPFFANDNNTPYNPWQVSQPPMKRNSRQPPLSISTITGDIEDLHLQYPKTPIYSDDHSTTTSHETTSSWNTHTSASSASLSSAPTSHDSHSSKYTPVPPLPPPEPLPGLPEKKKKPISMFWRKSQPETSLEAPGLRPADRPEPPPPSYETILNNRPPASRTHTAPDMQRPIERPSLPPRPITTAADSKPPPTASRRIVGGQTIPTRKLDRIDELDESNPLGLPLHHGGPYEAIKEKVPIKESEPYNVGSQYQRGMGKEKSRKTKRKPTSQATPIAHVPMGVSLNLAPGQILPYDLRYHHTYLEQPLDQPKKRSSRGADKPGRSSRTPAYTDNLPNLYPQRYDEQWKQEEIFNGAGIMVHDILPASLDGTQQRPHHRNHASTDFPGVRAEEVALQQRISASQMSSSYSEFSRDHHSGYDLHVTQPHEEDQALTPRQSIVEPQPAHNKQPSIERPPSATYRSNQSNSRLPPRMQALKRDKQMQNGRSVDEPPRHSQRNFVQDPGGFSADNMSTETLTSSEHSHHSHRRRTQAPVGFPPENMPIENPPDHRRRSQASGQRSYTPSIEPDQPPRFLDNNRASMSYGVAQPVFEIAQNYIQDQEQRHSPQPQQWPHDRDARSSQQSLASSGTSLDSGNLRNVPPPHHLPKRLVMPAPLQSSQPQPQPQPQPLAPRHQPQQHVDVYDWPPQTRPPSPPLVLPPVLGPYHQDLVQPPVPQTRKLRKRSSVQGFPPPTPTFPFSQAPLSFEPTIGYIDILPAPPAPPIRKPEKHQKRVLSKRRTDV